MTRTARQVNLGLLIAVMATFFVAFVMNRDALGDAPRPQELDQLGSWIADRPADWLAASLLSDRALDSELPRRLELWRAAYAHASRLAPRRTNPAAAFTRGGLFHWYELAPPDRAAVLRAAAPLLRDQTLFLRMYRPLWELTGDFAYLRRNAPDTERALVALRDLAVMNGRFDDYRELRAVLPSKRLEIFQQRRATMTPPELIALLPQNITKPYEPLVRGVLEELQHRPLDAGNAASTRDRAEKLIAYALRHDIRPLDGLEALIETPSMRASLRARLAIALGHDRKASAIELAGAMRDPEWEPYFLERAAFEEARGDRALAAHYRLRAVADDGASQWRGLCGTNEVCTSATRVVDGPLTIDVQNAQSDEVPPYVEVYVDDALVDEGAVEERRRFNAGKGRVELRVVNPLTRNRFQRRVRLS